MLNIPKLNVKIAFLVNNWDVENFAIFLIYRFLKYCHYDVSGFSHLLTSERSKYSTALKRLDTFNELGMASLVATLDAENEPEMEESLDTAGYFFMNCFYGFRVFL